MTAGLGSANQWVHKCADTAIGPAAPTACLSSAMLSVAASSHSATDQPSVASGSENASLVVGANEINQHRRGGAGEQSGQHPVGEQ